MIDKKVTHIMIYPSLALGAETFVTYSSKEKALEDYKVETDVILFECKEIRRKGCYRRESE